LDESTGDYRYCIWWIIVKTEERYMHNIGAEKDRFPEATTTEEGIPIIVRPIRPADKPRVAKLINSLSAQSIYLRFFSPIRSFSDEMIYRLTHIDCRNEIVLVALDPSQNMLGKAVICITEDGTRGEFAVLVADQWQGKGIGAALLKRCLMLARERGVETVWGRVLSENTKMLALGKKLGFVKKPTLEANEYEMVIDLKNSGNHLS